MDINKYLELLRFYITEKIEDINETIQESLDAEIEEIINTIISAILAVLISNETLNDDGVINVIFKATIFIVVYLLLKKVLIPKIHRLIKNNKQISESNEKTISSKKAKKFIDMFDHIACDGLLLSKTYLKKYCNMKCNTMCKNESHFYLFESLYYCKKALKVMRLIVEFNQQCVNGVGLETGISKYRLVNSYYMINELLQQMLDVIQQDDFEFIDEFKNELRLNKESLRVIEEYIHEIM